MEFFKRKTVDAQNVLHAFCMEMHSEAASISAIFVSLRKVPDAFSVFFVLLFRNDVVLSTMVNHH